MRIQHFLINALAGYRIVRFIQIDTLFDRPREWLWHQLKTRRTRKLRKLLDCPWCLSVHVAALVYVADIHGGLVSEYTLNILALSSIVGFLAWLDHEHIS